MTGLESIHNYYESLVLEEIYNRCYDLDVDSDQLADIACIALNLIPPKYIRHNIDMSFHMTDEDYLKYKKTVENAVETAFNKILDS